MEESCERKIKWGITWLTCTIVNITVLVALSCNVKQDVAEEQPAEQAKVAYVTPDYFKDKTDNPWPESNPASYYVAAVVARSNGWVKVDMYFPLLKHTITQSRRENWFGDTMVEPITKEEYDNVISPPNELTRIRSL